MQHYALYTIFNKILYYKIRRLDQLLRFFRVLPNSRVHNNSIESPNHEKILNSMHKAESHYILCVRKRFMLKICATLSISNFRSSRTNPCLTFTERAADNRGSRTKFSIRFFQTSKIPQKGKQYSKALRKPFILSSVNSTLS